MTDQEIDRMAGDVLGRVLGHAVFESAKAEVKPNHADEDSIFVTVRFRPGAGFTSRTMSGEALVALRDAFRGHGEERLPYVVYQFPDEPPPYSDDLSAVE